jgi:hypothetical protein
MTTVGLLATTIQTKKDATLCAMTPLSGRPATALACQGAHSGTVVRAAGLAVTGEANEVYEDV